MNKLFVPFLPPWVETGLQPAFYDKESGTVLQQTARMYDKVNQLIRNFNDLSKETKETVEEYILQFTELKDFVDDYFENLDVQEEINNKLDAMAEAGTLADIISQYLNSTAVFGYDNVASMKSAENLIAGSYAQTLGFYAKNDGGGATYRIRAITNDDVVDEATIIEMGDGSDELVAELIIEEPINVKTLGVHGDGTNDDYAKIQHAIDIFHHHTLYFPSGTYLITQPLEIGTTNAEQVDLKLDSDATIKTNTVIDSLLEIGKYEGVWNRGEEGATVTIEGGIFDATHTTQAIYLSSNRKQTRLLNLTILNVSSYGIYANRGTNTSASSDANIHGVSINGTGSEGSSVGMYLYAYDNKVSNCRVNACTVGIEERGGSFYEDVHCLASWSDGELNKANYEKTIGFKFNGGGASNLSQCYADTFGIGFQINTTMKVYLDGCMAYWYLSELGYDTKLFDVTAIASVRLYVDNFHFEPPEAGVGGSVTGLSVDGSGFRQFISVYDSFHFGMIDVVNPNRLKDDDFIFCRELYQEDSIGLHDPWTLTMTNGAYYPIAILGDGIYCLRISMGTDQIIDAKIVNRTGTPTITIENIINNSHSNQYTLAICNKGTNGDGHVRSYLCIKASANNCSFNPRIGNYKEWGNQLYTHYNPFNNTPLTSPTVNVETSFNP